MKLEQKRIGVGIMVRDYKQQVGAASCHVMGGCLEPVIAEAMGALFAVEFSHDLGLQQFILEGDSKQVVQAITTNGASWSRFGQVIEDIYVLLPIFRSWQVEHIKRDLNEVAHGLAKIAGNEGLASIWMEKIPHCIHDIVILEQSTLVV